MIHPFKHLFTITKHRHLVIKHCFKVGIGFQGMFHDLSKYSPTEFIPGMKYYQGNRSPNDKEREEKGYSSAWLHHKGRNKHHFEYWVDINITTHTYEPCLMPLRYVKEMFCDRIAATKVYLKDKYEDGAALNYFLTHSSRDKMHIKTAKLLEEWLRLLAEKGEKVAFKKIKKIKNRSSY